ncbi:MAG: PilZ domain-containing protein [Nitrospirae bacterium]|nr:MAG: PilZ domain-containing protein [Nitrospirota bacterium]
MELRKNLRFAVQLPLSFKGDKITGEGVVFNISLEGCGVVFNLSLEGSAVGSDTRIRPGTYFELCIQPYRQDLPIEVELAVVRWSEGREFGLEFIRIKAEDQDRLRRFVKTLEAGHGS